MVPLPPPPADATHAVISRADARLMGRARYFTGVPCKRGHVTERYVSNYVCVQCQAAVSTAERAVRYRAANPAKIAAANRQYYATHRAKAAEVHRRYRAQRPDVIAAKNSRYRARKAGRVLGDVEALRAFELYARSAPRIRCYWCRKRTRPGKRHLDHIIPLSQGGAHAVGNLCISCETCNLTKRAKMPEALTGQAEMALA